ncbi:flavodoxin domain-containing protein [Komagataeibacter rhaeticus]|nr:flavodoxin domain-containing protein [Komagataeibacter rhaeticus]
MSNTVVIFHSKYGHTKVVAKYVADGAQAQLIEIDADGNIQDGEWQALNDADAIIFGSPTYMGNVSWQFKKFSDDSSKIWSSGGWNDKILVALPILPAPAATSRCH